MQGIIDDIKFYFRKSPSYGISLWLITLTEPLCLTLPSLEIRFHLMIRTSEFTSLYLR